MEKIQIYLFKGLLIEKYDNLTPSRAYDIIGRKFGSKKLNEAITKQNFINTINNTINDRPVQIKFGGHTGCDGTFIYSMNCDMSEYDKKLVEEAVGGFVVCS